MIVKPVFKMLGLALLAYIGSCFAALAHSETPATHAPADHHHYHCHQDKNCHAHGHDAGHH